MPATRVWDVTRGAHPLTTLSSPVSPRQSPFYFCQHCYFALHYSPAGVLLYDDFAVVPYATSDG